MWTSPANSGVLFLSVPLTMHYTPKTITVQAVQFDGDNLPEVLEFIDDIVTDWSYCQIDRTLTAVFKTDQVRTIEASEWLVRFDKVVIVFDAAGFKATYQKL